MPVIKMELDNHTNPVNIQLAQYAKNISDKLKKENEEKHTELLKIQYLCALKEKSNIRQLYQSKIPITSSCNACHPSFTSVFQNLFKPLSLKDLVHERHCKPGSHIKTPCKTYAQYSTVPYYKYYTMRFLSWIVYKWFSFWYRGIIVHPEQIECLVKAQSTGLPIVFYLPPVRSTLSVFATYCGLYYSQLRPPLIYIENLPWHSRWLFKLMGLWYETDFKHSSVTTNIGPFYDLFVSYTAEDLHIVPVSVTFDKCIHINYAIPYLMSELETKYFSLGLTEDRDDAVETLNQHVLYDCNVNVPITSKCFVSYVLIVKSENQTIGLDGLLHCLQVMREELHYEKYYFNFVGQDKAIVDYSLKLLKQYLKVEYSVDKKDKVITILNGPALISIAFPIIFRKVLYTIVISCTYFLDPISTRDYLNTLREQYFDLLKKVFPQSSVPVVAIIEEIINNINEKKAKTDKGTADKSKNSIKVITINEDILTNQEKLIEDNETTMFTIKHNDLVEQCEYMIAILEDKLDINLFKFCHNKEDEINSIIDDLINWDILICNTSNGLLEEEKWCRNVARSFDLTEDEEYNTNLDTKTIYKVKHLEKNKNVEKYLNIMSGLIKMKEFDWNIIWGDI